jgi:hypothetical protein
MKIVQSESGEVPLEVDETSSPSTVYVRENIEPFTREDEMGGSVAGYRYLEKQYDRQEWEDLQIAKYVIDLEFRLVLLETQGGTI